MTVQLSMGKDCHQVGDKTEGLPGHRHIIYSSVWVQSLDSPVSCEEILPSPLELFEETAGDGVARQNLCMTPEVLNRANIPSISTLLVKAQLRWTGHVTRLPCTRLPKQIIFGELKKWQASTRWPQKGLQGFPESLLKELWTWPEKLGIPSSGLTFLEKKHPRECSPP